MDLDSLIDQAVVAALPRGRRSARRTPPSYVRDIGVEDIPTILYGAKAPNVSKRPLERARHTHHLAARLLAEGRKVYEVAEISGYTPQRISDLQNDPTFQELVEHYKAQTEAKWMNVHERLATLGIAMTEEIQQRLDEKPEGFSNEELRKWTETLLDRSGNGPSATRNVNVRSQTVSLQLIEQIKREVSDEQTNVKLLQAAE